MMKKTIAILMLLFPLFLSGAIYQLSIEGPIETITEEYISESFKKIKEAGDGNLVIITIDTPGGFSTSMRAIIQEIMESKVPVAVFVSPRGAQAASAGFLITISADIAVMAPGTNMGAAHPVAVTGTKMEDTMKEKVTNDAAAYVKSLAKARNRNVEWSEKAVRESKSWTAEECLKNNLAEYIAEDVHDLVRKLNGKKIKRVDKKTVELNLENQSIIFLEMSTRQKFLKTITNPNLAYFLLIFGLIGLYLEFTHAGAIVPGVLGGISLLLAFMAFQILPINYVGLLLILLSVGFFIAEIKIQGFGAFGIGGVVSFFLGSMMLIDAPVPEMRPTMTMIITFAVAFALVFLFLTFKVISTMKRGTETGIEGMTGEIGTVRSDITAEAGRVFVHGEWWNAVTEDEETIPTGSKVVVRGMENFVLYVSRYEA